MQWSMACPSFRAPRWSRPICAAARRLLSPALVAEGVTEVSAIHHIDRGYERFCDKLDAIGAHVERDTIPDPEED